MNTEVIHTIFEKIVKEKGSNIAVETEEKVMFSYADLNIHANQISYLLKENKVLKGDVVAAFFEEGVLQLIALLGIFKMGSIYLPLDKKYQENHWRELYDTIQPKALLVSDRYFKDIQEYDSFFEYSIPKVIVVSLNKYKEAIFSVFEYMNGEYIELQYETSFPINNPDIYVDGNDPNYIFFTSGSTGKPKAVLGKHKSLSHFINWESEELEITEKDRVGQLTSFSFDVSLRDIFLPLINGGTICIPPKSIKEDETKLCQWLKSRKITLVHTVPVMIRFLLTAKIENLSSDIGFPNLKYLISAGEKLYNKDIIDWRKKYGKNTNIINLYGATESTLAKTFYRVKELTGPPSQVICVGKPIYDTEVLILNSEHQICKENEIGDLYIRTPYLSYGYYGDQKLTEEKFIQNPLNGEEEIIYKIGDYGTYNADNNIVVIGRKDGVVKINGVRIDVNSVESTILELSEIKIAKCIVHQKENMHSLLVCFYSSEEPMTEMIREHCLKKLSQYEIPSFIVHLKTFPINVNGKIDTTALRQEIITSVLREHSFEAPSNENEKIIAQIWRDILRIDKVGVNDNFFALGGQSIKATQLINSYHKTFNVKLELKDLYRHNTLKSHSLLVASSERNQYSSIEGAKKQEDYAVSNTQKRLWNLTKIDEGRIAYYMHSVINLYGEQDIEKLEKAIDATIDRHEILRTVFIENDEGELRQKVLPLGESNHYKDFRDFRGKTAKEENIKRYLLQSSSKPYSLEKGPLLRMILIQLSDDHYMFYFNTHQIISDGASMEILKADILAHYEAYKNKKEVGLPELKIQYKDYADWQIRQLKEESSKRARAYWLNMLSGEIPLLNFPNQKSRPKIKTNNGNTLSTYITPQITERLRSFCLDNEGTLFIGILAIWNILFYKYTKNKDHIIATTVAGREHPDLENQIGNYMSTVVLRNRLNPTDHFVNVYKQIKEATLESSEHQMYPLDLLMDDLDLKVDISRNPIYDMMLTYNNKNDSIVLENDQYNKVTDRGKTSPKLDMMINFKEQENCFYFDVNYNTDIYDMAFIKIMMKDYKSLLSELLEKPLGKISEVDFKKEAGLKLRVKNLQNLKTIRSC
jgi:amino acid adenylation domain-containing protein